MIKSMTAFAVVEKNDDQGVTVSVELRTYNSRHLDMALRLPPGFTPLEETIRNLISKQLERGRVELRLSIKDASESAQSYVIDETKLKAYLAGVEVLKATAQISSPLPLEYLAGIPGIIVPADLSPAVQQHEAFIFQCINDALASVEQMRRQEGAFIGQDIGERLNDIEERLVHIEADSRDLPSIYREKLTVRMESLTNGIVALDPVRVAQEAAFLADRSDISEEIIRARSHIEQFRTIMTDNEPAGRRLNFLLQELNREFNTMGSKAGQAQVAHVIVDIKAEIEKIREQVQNIE